MYIPLRQAVIHSDFTTCVRVLPLGWASPEHMQWSHGACFSSWSEARSSELIFACMQVYALLTREAGISAARVHRAFCVIPEYRATLLAEHPDALKSDEWCKLQIMMDLPKDFRAQLDA